MSIQNALQFIHQVRKDDALRNKIHALGWQADLESLVQIGMVAGLAFTTEELQAAYKQDWAMRWFHYNAGTGE